jgi:hypothetical protein
MRRGMVGLAAVVMAVVAAGCSSNSTYTCNFTASVGICYQWSTSESLTSAEVDALQQACTGSGLGGATFTNGGSCPSTNRVGTCSFSASNVSYSWAYYTPTFNATDAQTACAGAGGTWSAG